MNIGDLSIELIGIFGGAQLLVAGLAAFLGKLWSERIIEREKANLSKELKVFEQELTAKTQFLLEQQRSDLEFSTRLAIHVAQTRYDEESATLKELWKRLGDLRKVSNDLTIRDKSVADSEEEVVSLRTTLTEARKEFGFWRQEKTLLTPQPVSEAVDRVVDVIAREADRVPDGRFSHPTLADFDRQAFTNIFALNVMMDKVKVAIEAQLVSAQPPTSQRSSGP